MTETAKLQEYIDTIYGEDYYRVVYESFKGFYAECLSPLATPHVQYLGPTANHAHAHLDEMKALKAASQEHSISALAELTNVGYDTLAKAAREGRIMARKSGGTWLSTVRAIEYAIENGTIRPHS